MMKKTKQNGEEELKGNDVYEGYCAELAEKIAEMIHFNYELKLVEDNKFGAWDNGSWNGMVGELINRVRTTPVCNNEIRACVCVCYHSASQNC